MSKISQLVIDTPLEQELEDSLPAIEYGSIGANPTPEDIAEAEKEMAVWSAENVMSQILWEVNIIINGVRLNALMIHDSKPDLRQGAALIATAYSQGREGAAKLIDQIRSGEASVIIHQPRLWRQEDINSNYIPF